MTSFFLNQIYWEYCVIPNIYIENILKYIHFFLVRSINWEYCKINNFNIENLLKFIDFCLLKPNKLGILRNSQYLYQEYIEVFRLLSSKIIFIWNISKIPIFILRIYWSILTSFFLNQINWKYCVILNINIDKILKFIDFILLKPNVFGILRNSQHLYREKIKFYRLLSCKIK